MNAPNATSDFLPCSIESEQALLGAALMQNEVVHVVGDLVRYDMFFEGIHQQTWKLIEERISAGHTVTPLTLAASLGKDASALIDGQTTVAQYLAKLAAAATTIMGAPEYAKTIRDLWSRRRLINLSRDLIQRATGGFDDEGIEAIMDEADAELCSIRYGKSIDGVVTMGQAITSSIDQTAKAYQGGALIGLTTGIEALDGMTGPLLPGYLVTLLGASGHGKTALVAQILKHNAEPSLDTNAGARRGLFFSMEMEGAEIARRVLAAATGYGLQAQKTGNILPAEFEFLVDAGKRLSALPILFDQTPGQTVTKIARKARALKKRYPDIALIAVDHILEIRAEHPRWSKIETAENAVQELKRLAKELQVVIILLAQATREGQKRDHWRLRTNDIYGGDRIKQSSDVVLALGIPSVWLSEREPDSGDLKEHDKWLKQCHDWVGKAEIGAPKVRDGESGSWRTISFDGKKTLFGDL